jgi:hypothetical protein
MKTEGQELLLYTVLAYAWVYQMYQMAQYSCAGILSYRIEYTEYGDFPMGHRLPVRRVEKCFNSLYGSIRIRSGFARAA